MRLQFFSDSRRQRLKFRDPSNFRRKKETMLKTFLAALLVISGLSLQALADEPYFGAYLVDETKSQNGALLEDIQAGSPAAKAGFKKGDLILKWNGTDIQNGSDLIKAITSSKPGATVKLVASRNGWSKSVDLVLGTSNPERASQKPATHPGSSSREPGFLGVYLKSGDSKGALIEGTVQGSPAREAGLKRGDVISAVNGETIENPQNLIEKLSKSKVGETLKLKVLRDGWAKTWNVTLGKRPAPQSIEEKEPAEKQTTRPATRRTTERQRGFLGVAVDGEDQDKLVVAEVQANSSADKSGIKAGDVIESFDGVGLKNVGDLRSFMEGKYAGDTITVVILRDGWKRTIKVKLTAREE